MNKTIVQNYNELESYAYEANEKMLTLEQNIAELRLGLLKIRSCLDINQKEYEKRRNKSSTFNSKGISTFLYYDIINDVKDIISTTLAKT
tara:strand:- start:8087 stop:8356 length:270 start_codon:yes stop_codon:yes gene_type:complete